MVRPAVKKVSGRSTDDKSLANAYSHRVTSRSNQSPCCRVDRQHGGHQTMTHHILPNERRSRTLPFHLPFSSNWIFEIPLRRFTSLYDSLLFLYQSLCFSYLFAYERILRIPLVAVYITYRNCMSIPFSIAQHNKRRICAYITCKGGVEFSIQIGLRSIERIASTACNSIGGKRGGHYHLFTGGTGYHCTSIRTCQSRLSTSIIGIER